MTNIETTSSHVAYDHRGIRLGTVRANGDVYSNTGIRIGTADRTGRVYDHLRRWIGTTEAR